MVDQERVRQIMRGVTIPEVVEIMPSPWFHFEVLATGQLSMRVRFTHASPADTDAHGHWDVFIATCIEALRREGIRGYGNYDAYGRPFIVFTH